MAVDLPRVHEKALEHTRTYVAGVQEGQWHDATPDKEWDVHELVNHIVTGNYWAEELASG